MNSIVRAIAGLSAAAVMTACGGTDVGSAPGAPQHVTGQTIAAPSNLHPHSPYEFWIVNHASKTLHVFNTHGGKCMSKEIPTVDIAPNSKLGFVVDTVSSGSCFFESKTQAMNFSYDRGTLRIHYSIHSHSENWVVQKMHPSDGTIDTFTGQAPVTNACTTDASDNPTCGVRTGRP
jgi:hypothetical protein